ncbi:MAG: hypothetical protein WKF58_02735 [Ilumatobacteraceae bacterium]
MTLLKRRPTRRAAAGRCPCDDQQGNEGRSEQDERVFRGGLAALVVRCAPSAFVVVPAVAGEQRCVQAGEKDGELDRHGGLPDVMG